MHFKSNQLDALNSSIIFLKLPVVFFLIDKNNWVPLFVVFQACEQAQTHNTPHTHPYTLIRSLRGMVFPDHKGLEKMAGLHSDPDFIQIYIAHNSLFRRNYLCPLSSFCLQKQDSPDFGYFWSISKGHQSSRSRDPGHLLPTVWGNFDLQNKCFSEIFFFFYPSEEIIWLMPNRL